MVLSNTVVIIHDMPLINTPVIIAPCQIIIFFPPFKKRHPFSGRENISEETKKKKKKKGIPLLSQTSPTPPVRLGSLTLDNRLKRGRGAKMRKDLRFHKASPPPVLVGSVKN